VAEAVVDLLEVVEVDEEDRQPPPVAARAVQRAAHPVDEQAAVGQAGQLVVQRRVRELLRELAVAPLARGERLERPRRLGDVLDRPDEAGAAVRCRRQPYAADPHDELLPVVTPDPLDEVHRHAVLDQRAVAGLRPVEVLGVDQPEEGVGVGGDLLLAQPVDVVHLPRPAHRAGLEILLPRAEPADLLRLLELAAALLESLEGSLLERDVAGLAEERDRAALGVAQQCEGVLGQHRLAVGAAVAGGATDLAHVAGEQRRVVVLGVGELVLVADPAVAVPDQIGLVPAEQVAGRGVDCQQPALEVEQRHAGAGPVEQRAAVRDRGPHRLGRLPPRERGLRARGHAGRRT
jgi:hypothetical protein